MLEHDSIICQRAVINDADKMTGFTERLFDHISDDIVILDVNDARHSHFSHAGQGMRASLSIS